MQPETIQSTGGVPNQYGTWVYGRAGWCPGQDVAPYVVDITEYVKNGKNHIHVEVYKYSDGSYLEGQDTWRLSGLERDVSVYSLPKTRVSDYFINSTLDSAYNHGLFNLSVDLVSNEPSSGKYVIKALLSRIGGKSETVYDTTYKTKIDSAKTIRFNKTIKNVKTWNAEQPNLYQLQITLLDPFGKILQSFTQSVGFRKVEIIDGQLKLNGNALTIRGVNRHEWDPIKGRSIDEKSMINDIKVMKENNRSFIYELESIINQRICLLYTSPSPRDSRASPMPRSA